MGNVGSISKPKSQGVSQYLEQHKCDPKKLDATKHEETWAKAKAEAKAEEGCSKEDLIKCLQEAIGREILAENFVCIGDETDLACATALVQLLNINKWVDYHVFAALLTEEKRQLVQSVLDWIDWDPNADSKEAVAKLLSSGDFDGLRSQFEPRIAFGTAGLRAKMDWGYKYLNELVVIQASQGLCKYAEANISDAKTKGIVIGYDGRHNSDKFAQRAAGVFLSRGWKVYLFQHREIDGNQVYSPTPLVSYGINCLNTALGLMVTASHNPKQDNGYKVYWNNTAQIISPHDKGISDCIFANLKPWDGIDCYTDDHKQLDLTCWDTVADAYFAEIAKSLHWNSDEENKSSNPLVYTAMHGVGAYWVQRAFEAFGLPAYIPVESQLHPDPEFPTADFPNPEEKGALDNAQATADEKGVQVIIANDPDADRLAVAEKQADGSWTQYNGNAIALLFADWILRSMKAQDEKWQEKKPFMLASTVSSQILGAMAKKEGFNYEDTLTGFKWMGNVADQKIKKGEEFWLAFEVEIGFCINQMSLDKDGVRTAAIFAELCHSVYKDGKTLSEHLQGLYNAYGFYSMIPGYFFSHDKSKLGPVYDAMRNLNNGSFPTEIPYADDEKKSFKVVSVRDVTRGKTYDLVNNTEADSNLLKQDYDMLTFYFDTGAWATFRNSGTEPKLKYYIEARSEESMEAAEAEAKAMESALIKALLKPQDNKLWRKGDTPPPL